MGGSGDGDDDDDVFFSKYQPSPETNALVSEFDSALGSTYATCGRLAALMGLHQLAVANFAKGMQKLPQDSALLVDFAKALGAEAKQEGIVVSTLVEAMQRGHENSDHRIWGQLAESYYLLQKPEDAFQSVSRAIAAQEIKGISDSDLWTLQARILLLWMDSDGKMGLDTLTPYFFGAIKIALTSGNYRNELQSRVSLAQLYHRFACYPESQAELSRAFTLAQSQPSSSSSSLSSLNTLCYIYNFMSILQFKMNQKADAYAMIQESITTLPKVAVTTRLLATLAQFYMIDESLPQLSALIPALLIETSALKGKEPIRFYLINWILGRVYDMLDDTKQSYEFYQQAVNCKPHSSSLWIGIGCLYLRMRQFEDAHIAFSHALNYASKLENYEQPFLLRFNRLFAAFAWVGLSQVFVATFNKQSALDALRQASVLFTAEGDHVHADQVDQIYNDVFSNTTQNPVYVVMNVPPQLLLELFLYYDSGVFPGRAQPLQNMTLASCEPAARIMPAMAVHPQLNPASAYSPQMVAPAFVPAQAFNELNARSIMSQQLRNTHASQQPFIPAVKNPSVQTKYSPHVPMASYQPPPPPYPGLTRP